MSYSVKDFTDLVIRFVFAQLLCDLLQLVPSDVSYKICHLECTFGVHVEEIEGTLEIRPRIAHSRTRRGNAQELLEVDASRVVAVQLGQDTVDHAIVRLETHILEGLDELLRVDRP